MRATVLVVDDDAAIRRLVAKRLRAAGYEVELAAGGEQALAAVERGGISMVVLDIEMPGLDGFSVLERLRARRDSAQLPVVVLSAKQEGEDVVRALRAGANDYATKPVRFGLLLKRIAAHLSLTAGRGRRVGPYRIGEKLGSGGMGIVFAAEDTRTGSRVALKALPRAMTVNTTNVERFVREARLAARVDHPNVVKILDAGKDGEFHYFTMELVRGETLRRIAERRPLRPEQAVTVGRQIAAGLSALALAGILHRDVKPGNVMITDDGVAKLTDFGVARDLETDTRLTRAGVGVGSLMFASPEQIRGQAELRSDIYGLGATLYYGLTGNNPFPSGHDADWMLAYKLRHVPRLREARRAVPASLAAVIERMLEPRAADRYASYEDVDAALSSDHRSKARRWLVWAAAGTALLAALVLCAS